MAALSGVKDPSTGEPVFGLIMTRDEAKVLGLYGDRAGDVIFSMRPGYAASRSKLGAVFGDVIPLKTPTGMHADLPYYPQLVAIFGATGANIIHGKLGYIHSTSIAPTIAYILGIEPPLNATGNILPIVKPLTKTVTETETETVTQTVTTTNTVTQTIEKTTTQTETETTTLTETVTRTSTVTTTMPQTTTKTVTTTKLETTTKTEYETKTIEKIETGTMISYAIVALIIGIVIGILIYRLTKPTTKT